MLRTHIPSSRANTAPASYRPRPLCPPRPVFCPSALLHSRIREVLFLLQTIQTRYPNRGLNVSGGVVGAEVVSHGTMFQPLPDIIIFGAA